jgi:FkbM family methyltransferase
MRLLEIVGHAWRVRTPKPVVFALLDAAAIGPVRAFWEKEVPWQLGKYVERHGNQVRIDGCRLDMSAAVFSTFQRGCFWLQRYEEPERIGVSRYLDSRLPVVELGASTGMLSCLINKRLRAPAAHVAVEANPDLIPVLEENRRLNHCSYSVVHAAVAYESTPLAFAAGNDHLAGRADSHGEGDRPVASVTLGRLLDRFQFDRATLVCDIEGMEVDLCRNEADTLGRRIAWLIIELHEPISGTAAVEDLLRVLSAQHFELVWQCNWTRVFRNVRLADGQPHPANHD